jgi:CRISPR-associated protein Csm1
MTEQTYLAALAGLMHDVGKLIQRARPDPWTKPESFRDEDMPVHAAWSAEYIWQQVPEAWRGPVLHAAYHHKPGANPAADPGLSQLVALADKLSAGERSDLEQNEKASFPMQLLSIFDQIRLNEKPPGGDKHYLPLAELALKEETLFPGGALPESDQRQAYQKLVDGLEKVSRYARENLSKSLPAYLEQMLAALQQTTWCVPSAYYHSLPDVSLYDHSRMTAAIAACLSGWDPDPISAALGAVTREFSGKSTPADRERLEQPALLLVGGDISGIQDFIYTLSANRAARTLRGRSFYLQLLTEAVLRFVLNRLEIPYTNVIFSGGGHFYLLAPLNAETQLQDVQREITQKLLGSHGTALYLALGWQKVPFSGFKKGRFALYWEQMHAQLRRAKQRRYGELGEDLYDRLFAAQANSGNQQNLCGVCGIEAEDVRGIQEEGEEDLKVCGLCRSFYEQIGSRLANAPFTVLGIKPPVDAAGSTALDVLASFGMSVEVHRKDQRSFSPQAGADYSIAWSLDGEAIADTAWLVPHSHPMVRVNRYAVNQIPAESFDKLMEKAAGIKRLAVLRYDVDDMGEVFQHGFGIGEKNTSTLARLSTLSFQLSLFFEGWVKQICRQTSPDIYAVYAGGDDGFLIGPWQEVPGLAKSISDDFARFTGHNPDLHLSAGMSFIHGKYPIHQAARDAGRALAQAKGHNGKNAFEFLGHVWTWPKFADLVERKEAIENLYEQQKGKETPHAMLQILQNLAHQEQAWLRANPDKKRVWGRWLWLGDYMLTRMAERGKKDGQMEEQILSIRNQLQMTQYADILMWGKAARWVQLLNRKASQDRDHFKVEHSSHRKEQSMEGTK